MPLYHGAASIVKANLLCIQSGQRPQMRAIGILTQQQHDQINACRAAIGYPLLEMPEILYIGRHHFTSRSADGYSIDDMWLQIEWALQESSVAYAHTKMTGIQAVSYREDGYGNRVMDKAVFELLSRKPRAELYSVIPKGDLILPKNTKAFSAEAEKA